MSKPKIEITSAAVKEYSVDGQINYHGETWSFWALFEQKETGEELLDVEILNPDSREELTQKIHDLVSEYLLDRDNHFEVSFTNQIILKMKIDGV